VALSDLRERADSVLYTTEELPPGDESTIVAGRAIDLSGDLDCLGWECVQKQIDLLFKHVWHYFDRIVVVGPSANDISSAFHNETDLPHHLHTYIRLLLYLRDIGAEDLLLFRQKRPPCQLHLKQHLKEAGIEGAEEQAESLMPRLAQEATIKLRHHNDHIHYTFIHPDFEHTVWGSLSANSNVDLSYEVARAVVKRHLAALASDVFTARMLSCPLGSTVRFLDKVFAISTLPTIYGLHTLNPLFVAVGLTPAVNSLTNAAHKYIEEQRDIALSDMFFLWQAQKHGLNHVA
jgi:hypothetical protein